MNSPQKIKIGNQVLAQESFGGMIGWKIEFR